MPIYDERLMTRGGRPSSPRKPHSQLRLTTTDKCSQIPSWTAKRQIAGKMLIPLKYSVANCVAPVKVFLHPNSTPSLETPVSSSSNLLLEGKNSSTNGPASPASTSHTDSAAPTPHYPVILTPPPPCPAFAALSSPPTSTPLTNVYFGPGTEEALMYSDLSQAP